MKVGIIGAGFSGLSAAYFLSKNGFDVTIFESEEKPGGLALGFQKPKWQWSIERHYHHWFTSDWDVRNLAKEIGHEVFFVRPKTSNYLDGQVLQLDSPLTLLKFNKLTIFDRIRTGIVLAFLKLTPDWKFLEKFTAKEFLIKTMGKKPWELLWEPLFVKKFDKYVNNISAAWFWARIKKRSASLGYPSGGFLAFAQGICTFLKENGVDILYNQPVSEIRRLNDKIILKFEKKTYKFDYVISTLPTPLFFSLTKGFPVKYIEKYSGLKGVGAINMVLSLKKKLLKDNTYWLSINDMSIPFLAVVEHTNFMNKKFYNNENLVFVGNYVDHEHKYFNLPKEKLLKIYLPFLKKINKNFDKSWIKDYDVFKAKFAQPIIPVNYSRKVPPFTTPIKNLFLCNIQQVYPWDRGTNYAVENGRKVAELIINMEK